MLVSIIGLIVSFIPALLLFRYLCNVHGEDPEYRKNCRQLLLNGILCSLGVAVLDLVLSIIWNAIGIARDVPLANDAFRTFVLASFVEELVKHANASGIARKKKDRICWLDCIAYFSIVGIGFQIIESIVYLIESNVIQILARGFTLGHPSYGMLMGYFIGKAHVSGNRSYGFLAFFLPFFLHGMYDFSLSDSFSALNDNLVFIPFILIAIDLIVLIRMLKLIGKKKNDPEFTTPFFRSDEEKGNGD